jgi:predicted RNase H-like HicB family nuclease
MMVLGHPTKDMKTGTRQSVCDSVEETERLMREAIALYLEELRASGESIPEPTSVARTVEVVA